MNFIQLSNNISLPQIGLGTFDLKSDSIRNALDVGYRLLDSAWQYQNETEVKKAVADSGIDRRELYITTKLWTEDIRKNRVREALEESLRNLGTDYVDLYLIHWPAFGFERAWDTMAELRDEGKIREIGVSNFSERHFELLAKILGEIPVINQVESHPHFCNDGIIQFCRKQNIAVQAWCPLGGSYSRLKEEGILKKLSEKYNKTAVQLILRWHIQRNVMVIPRTSKKDRMKENLDIYDFELEQTDMEKISALNTGKRMGADPDNFSF